MGNSSSSPQPQADHFLLTLVGTLKEGMRPKYDSSTAELSDIVKNHEGGAICYEFHLGEDGKTSHLHGHYATSDDFLVHTENFHGKILDSNGGKLCETYLTFITHAATIVYGNPSDKAKEALASLNPVYFRDVESFQRGNGAPSEKIMVKDILKSAFGTKRIAGSVSDLGMFHLVLKVDLTEGKLEEFESLAKERIEYIRTNEIGVLFFSFYASEDGKKVQIYMRFEDQASFATHFNDVSDGLKEKIGGIVDYDSAEFDCYGKPSDHIRNKLEGKGTVTYLNQTSGFTRYA